MSKLYVTLLAGGMGKRMNSDIPKVLHLINNIPMIVCLINQIILLSPFKILIVVGKYHLLIKETIEQHISDKYILDKIVYVFQEYPLGTGDAVRHTIDEFTIEDSDNIILNADTPMLKYRTINNIYKNYLIQNSKLLISCIELDDPTGNGRIIINGGHFKEIIEEKDCDPEQAKIKLVNCGIYISKTDILKKYIPMIQNNNTQREYYLTDLVKVYKTIPGNNVDLHKLDKNKYDEIYNINTQLQLLQANNILIK